MYESPEEIAALQALLDASHARATGHLRGIIDDERRLTADDLVGLLTGMRVISVATVTATGEPRISALDGHFLHGTWTFSTSGSAAKATHLQARPAVSASYVEGEDVGIFSHGEAQRMRPEDADWEPTLKHWTAHYGGSPLAWGEDIRLYRLRQHWVVGYAAHRRQLRADRHLTAS